MRDRPVRLAFLGLILALPPLILATTPQGASLAGPSWPMPGTAMLACAVEAVLVVGLGIAGRQRQMLQSRGAR